MKLNESFELTFSSKRKWGQEHIDRKPKRATWSTQVDCDIDVLQARIRATKSNQLSNLERLRVLHSATYPVNCDPIDGISPNHYMMQVRSTSCTRCLQGEAGHFRHIIESRNN